MNFLLNFVLAVYCMPLLAQYTPSVFNNKEEAQKVFSKTLDQIPQLLKDDPTGIKAQQFLRKDRLPQWIQNYFYVGSGPLHESSAERQVRVKEIEQILAPYEKMLIDLSFLTKNDNAESGVALQFLIFSASTQSLKSFLMNLTQNVGHSPDLLEKACDMIYGHQMDDAEFRKKTIEFIIEHRDTRSTKRAIASALYSSSKRAALPEMMDLYLNDLAIPLRPENYVNGSRSLSSSRIVAAAQGLTYFGLLGGDRAVTLIRARLLELDLNSGDEQNAKLILEDALERVLGNRPPEIAVSRKGQLLGISNKSFELWKMKNPLPKSSTPTVTAQSTPVSASATPNQQPKFAASPTPSLTTAETKSTPSPWIIGAILLLAVVGGVLLKFLRK